MLPIRFILSLGDRFSMSCAVKWSPTFIVHPMETAYALNNENSQDDQFIEMQFAPCLFMSLVQYGGMSPSDMIVWPGV